MFFFSSVLSCSLYHCFLVYIHPTPLGKGERQGDTPCTPAGEVPCTPFFSHLRCFCSRHYMPGEVLISASPRNHSITVLSFCVTSFQEGQRVVAVRVKVAVARISCDDAPTSTSNSPAS